MNYFQQVCLDSRAPNWANDRGFAEIPEPIPAIGAGEFPPPPPETSFAGQQLSPGPSTIHPASLPARDDEPMREETIPTIFVPKVQPAISAGLEIGSQTAAETVGTTTPETAIHEVSAPKLAAVVHPHVTATWESSADPNDSAHRNKDRLHQIGRAPKATPLERDLSSAGRRLERRNDPERGQFRASAAKAAQDPVVTELNEVAPVNGQKDAHVRREPASPAHAAAVSKEGRERSASALEYDPRLIGYASGPDRTTEAMPPSAPSAPQVRIGHVDVVIQSPTPPRPATTAGTRPDGRATPWYLRTL